MNPRFKKAIDISLILLFLAGITILSSYLYLYDGIASGDDYSFHLSNVYECYYGLTHGFGLDSTNHITMGIYGYNTHLFYAPLPHYMAAILMVMFNCSNIVAIKLTISLFCFLGALFFYLFAKKVSKGNIAVSLISTAFFIFCPYRMFCGYCRFAYAETIAISIIPILLYGIYSITHDAKPSFFSFIAVILGVSGLILTHPFTALTAVIFALIYMAIRYRNVWGFLKTKKGLVLSIITVIDIFALISFYFFPMIQAQTSGLYRISDNQAVWTTYEHVAGSTANSWRFSGFLNLSWIEGRVNDSKWPSQDTPYMMLLGAALLIVSALIIAISDYLTSKFFKKKYLTIIISTILSFIPIIFFVQRLEIYLALVLILVIYFISKFFDGKESECSNPEKGFIKVNKGTLIDVIFLTISTLVLLILIFIDQSWYIMPSIFYSCQFAWRLWSMVTITLSWLFIILLNALAHQKYRSLFLLASSLPAILFALSMSFPEKRVAITYPEANAYIIKKYEEAEMKNVNNIGAMNEYIPVIFYDKEYVSEYDKSLYGYIKSTIGNHNKYVHTAEDYIQPSFLTGDGKLTCKELETPNVIFDAIVEEDNSLIQLPQFYYDGYEVAIYDNNDEYITTTEVINIDSLVSFKIDKGEYTIKVTYKGPVVRRIFNIFFYLGVSGIAILTGLGICEKYRLTLNSKKPPLL